MKQVGQALRDGLGYYDTPEAGADRLRLLLKDKAVLLVLDDVWDARHVEPFLVNALRCRTLFTTRNADIALRLGAQEVPLGVLEPEQAVALLREWAKRDDPALPDIAERLGYLPLALRLAGTQLHREGVSGAEWLKTFRRVSQLKLGRYSTDPQENLQVCFDLSVRQLPAEDQQLYYALGIFPEDARIPQSVVARLWRRLVPELNQYDCKQLVIELKQRALIEWNAADESVTLHDLLREYTREQLGDELAATHAALLSAYNPDGKPWSQIEHDGYLYYHLAYHLREAGRKGELYELLTGSPDWMEAKFTACTGDTTYVADLDLAIGDFADPLTDPYRVMTLVKLHTARQVVNARVSSYTDTDLRTLVWLGREDEALAHLRLRSDTKDQFEGLLSVYDTLKEREQLNLSLLHEAREVARGIEEGHSDKVDKWRSYALRVLATAFAQAGDLYRARELFDEALEVVRRLAEWRGAILGGSIEVGPSIGDHVHISVELSSLAAALAQAGEDHRAKELFNEAEEVARREIGRSIEDFAYRSLALEDLASALAQVKRYEEAKEVACSIPDERARWYALRNLAAALTQAKRYDEAQEVARNIEEDRWRSYALRVLAAALTEAGEDCRGKELFDEVREAAHNIADYEDRLDALSSLASALAQARHFNYGLAVFGLRKLDTFLQALAQWAPSFEQVKQGLSVDVLREATGIAGWVRSDWRKIHGLLNS
jgi:tetratricopeptide (TPR) repeat protein